MALIEDDVYGDLRFDGHRPRPAEFHIAPGLIFSPCRRYRHCIRLSFGHPWSERIETAIAWLDRTVSARAGQRASAPAARGFRHLGPSGGR